MKSLLIAGAAIALSACTSPEASRTQGGGPGADTGNRGDVVRMHAGSQPYYKTPHLAPGQPGPTETARHARQVASR